MDSSSHRTVSIDDSGKCVKLGFGYWRCRPSALALNLSIITGHVSLDLAKLL